MQILRICLLSLFWLFPVHSATLETINTGPLYNVQMILGGRAELPCSISTQDPTDRVILVLWYKDGEGSSIYTYDSRRSSRTNVRDWSDARTLGGRAHFDITSSPSSLVLDNVRSSDEGLYRCRVDFKKSPTRKARTNLTVIIPPNPPVILSENGVQVWSMVGPYDEGASLSLTCEVTGGKPPPEVTWWLGEQLLDDSFESPRPGVYTNMLHVPNMTRDHLHASMVCQASNSNYSSPVQSVVTVEMNFKPLSVKFLGSNESLSAGKHYELECQSVGARPPAVITWWLGKTMQLTNTTSRTANSGNVTLSKLYFTPDPSHGKMVLTCRAQSPVIKHTPISDDWQLVVFYAPIIDLKLGSSLKPDSIREGDDVYFECHIKANPSLYKIVWYHNGALVQHNISAGVIISNQSLVIQKVKREHAGLFTCVASNLEGDGESDALVLKVQYAPVCARDNIQLYGAARHEEVTVTCHLDAVPPTITFSWRFNNSGDIVDIAESHVSTKGLQSSLSYIARTELDYGTLLCWGTNELGRQRKPCIYKVVPAGPPEMPVNCTFTNASASSLHVHCSPGYDGGLGQTFIAEVFEIKTNHLRLNISEVTYPDFNLVGLESGTTFEIMISAVNSKGHSKKYTLTGYTLKDIAERRTAQVRPPPDKDIPITPLLAVAVGVAGSLLLVVLVAVVILRLNKERRRPRSKPLRLSIHTPLSDSTKEADDMNPDVIPSSGSDQEIKLATPEDGGFGAAHICAGVPSYSGPYPNTVYTTLQNGARLSNSQEASDLVYADLALHCNHFSSSVGAPRWKGNSVLYAKQGQSSEGLLSAPYCSVISPSGSSSVGSLRRTTHNVNQQYPSHINSPMSSIESSLPLGVPHSSSKGYSFPSPAFGLQEGGLCVGVSYKPSLGIAVGYDGHIPPPALPGEGDVLPSAETPLINHDNKESSV